MNGFASRPAFRLRWRWLCAVAAMAAVGGLSVMARADLWWPGDGVAGLDGEGRRSQAYVLESGRLDFDVPARALELRVLTTALVEPGELGRRDEWRYGIVLDLPGGRQEQFFRSRATLFQTTQGTKRYALTILGDLAQGSVPLDSRTARFRRSPGEGPFTLSIEPLRGSEPTKLAVRVYFRERVPEHRRGTVWPRLSERERRQRAVGNVYPPELLTAEERAELMSFRWSALAPRGVEGDDYERLVLFQHAEPGRPVVDGPATLTSGLRLPAGVRFRLPSFKGSLVARALSAPGGPLLETEAGQVGRGLRLESSSEDVETYAVDTEATLELLATADVALTAQPEDGEVDLRAEALRLYGCKTPLEYTLTHRGAATPLRVDLRSATQIGALQSGTIQSVAEATIELLDDSGTTLSRRRIEVESSTSPWDWLDEPGAPRRVSEAARRYLSTSMNATRVRFTNCTDDLRIAVYNRPGAQPADRSSPPGGDDIKDWWVLLPRDKEEQTSSLLRLQPRAETAPSRDFSARVLRDLRPEGGDGRYVLLPIEQSDAPGYARLVVGRQAVEIASREDRGTVQPRLLYRRTARSPFRLVLRVDGQALVNEELAGRQGELLLPAVRPGRRSVQLEAAPEVDVYLGNVAAAAKRFARRLTFEAPSSFTVDWDHDGTRTAISGRLFTEGSAATCSAQAALEGAGRPLGTPSRFYTFPSRRWSFGESTEVAALGSDALTLRRTAPFFFLLGEDVEAGSVTLRYRVSCPGRVFMTLAVLDEAPEESVRVWRESPP